MTFSLLLLTLIRLFKLNLEAYLIFFIQILRISLIFLIRISPKQPRLSQKMAKIIKQLVFICLYLIGFSHRWIRAADILQELIIQNVGIYMILLNH